MCDFKLGNKQYGLPGGEEGAFGEEGGAFINNVK